MNIDTNIINFVLSPAREDYFVNRTIGTRDRTSIKYWLPQNYIVNNKAFSASEINVALPWYFVQILVLQIHS